MFLCTNSETDNFVKIFILVVVHASKPSIQETEARQISGSLQPAWSWLSPCCRPDGLHNETMSQSTNNQSNKTNRKLLRFATYVTDSFLPPPSVLLLCPPSFEVGSVDLTQPVLPLQTRLALCSQRPACLCVRNVGIKGLCCHSQPEKPMLPSLARLSCPCVQTGTLPVLAMFIEGYKVSLLLTVLIRR